MKEPDLCDSCKRHIEREVLTSKGHMVNLMAYGCESWYDEAKCHRDEIVAYTILCMKDKGKEHEKI